MSSSSSSSQARSQRRRSIEEDMISTLPDSILTHIISFLPTKYAASTRVLSKRWNPLYPSWLLALTHDFDVESFEDIKTFRHDVYPNMLPIQRFITAAMQRGIEKVYELNFAHGIVSVNLRCPHLLYIVHTFQNLTQIEVFFLAHKGKIWSGKWRWMLEVLQHSTKLQHLAIHQEMENTVMENVGISETNWEDPQIVPHCLSSQLRTCKNDIQFAKYVMQNSKALRTMTVHSVCSVDLNAKYQMLQKLIMCRRSCKILFD